MESRPLRGRLLISVALYAVRDLGSVGEVGVGSGRVVGRCRLAASCLFPCLDALLCRGTTVSKAIRLVARLHDVTVVGEPVEKRGGHLGVAEYAGPFAE